MAIRGRIDGDHSSLIAAVDATGERVQLAISLAELFSGQIDFENDLQPGDSFEVLFETTTYQGAVRRVRRDPRRAIHERRQGAPGLSLGATRTTQKAGLLRRAGTLAAAVRAGLAAPVHAARDVGVLAPPPAPGLPHRQGSPRRRLRGADRHAGGRGRRAASSYRRDGRAGADGRCAFVMRADSRATTCTSRRSRKGIRAGAHVDQGQLIGRVGSTGTATGPHLDYRLRKNGVFVDPRREHARQPPGEPIPAHVPRRLQRSPATACCSSSRRRVAAAQAPPPAPPTAQPTAVKSK